MIMMMTALLVSRNCKPQNPLWLIEAGQEFIKTILVDHEGTG